MGGLIRLCVQKIYVFASMLLQFRLTYFGSGEAGLENGAALPDLRNFDKRDPVAAGRRRVLHGG